MTKQSQIDISVNNVEINSFALSGISAKNQTIIDSNVNISLQFPVLTGALLCIICDVDVQQCNLVFIAKGQQISGLIIEPKERVNIQSSFIQFRISSMNSSGIANIINQSSVSFQINQCKLTGYNLLQSKYNGYIASSILVNIQLNITQMYICVDKTQRFGTESVQISIIGSDSIQCDICEQQQVVYGLCGEVLNYSEHVDGMYQCMYPFEYVDNKCVCAYGYILNNSKCINITESLNNISNQVNSGNSAQIQLLEQKVLKIENQIIIVDQSILGNITEIENRIISNYSKSDFNLITNISTLDNRIHNNITSIKNDILITQITADTNLLSNTTVLDWRIFNNVSQINSNYQNLTLQLIDFNNSMQQQNQIIQQQQNIINNLTQKINCTSNYGYSMINGTCTQVQCVIIGQQNINGICQCTNIYSIIQDGSCVCPAYSNVIGTACMCFITGQTMQNGQCGCSTTGAFVVNSACTCGVNSINISNSCSCPSGASLVNGVCTCSNINAFISGSQCICPTHASLVDNSCTCPNNSAIENNICVCNQIIGQIMVNRVCECQTSGAFVNNGACVCGLYALNISNMCTCPTSSSLVNNICSCDKVQGQQIINGNCQCQFGQSVENNSCKIMSHSINYTNFECSQQIYSSNPFNIIKITHQITISSNFSAGYVFSSVTVIQNSFIEILDFVYTSNIKPLFQFQSIFINIKLQFGTQSLNSGSLILSSSTEIEINQMYIISTYGSTLTVNSAKLLNILTASTINANITNMLVNLTFAPSSGNITLVSEIQGVFNISGYQVFGTIVSTQTVAMVGINLNNAIIIVNYINFKPSVYNVGNVSSYLFSYAVTSTNQIKISNFAVIIGNSSNYQILGSISTQNSYNNYYIFGGIISHIDDNSTVSVNNVILDSYQKFSSSYVSQSGFLVGFVQSTSSSVTIINVCMQQQMTSTTLEFTQFAIFGDIFGAISIQQVSLVFFAQGAQFFCFGIIGIQTNLQAEVINLRTSVRFSLGLSCNSIGSIFGYIRQTQNCSIFNVSVVGNINAGSCIGGLIGFQYTNTKTTIQNSTVSKINIYGSSYIGGFVGYCYTTILLIKSNINAVYLSGQTDIGIVVGFNSDGGYSFSGSSSAQNYINGVKQTDCAVLSNNWSVVGC
ncbi:Conserved_hypothetical protein [Hexamita inflata]|uniref:Transmembrane protein n=1 Tax=Hexamita inflata TaxID=28002 RepID=A0ABP1GKX2_9EUKA